MLDFLHKTKKKTKEKKGKGKTDFTLGLVMALGAVVGFAVSYFTSSVLFFPIILFACLFSYGLLKNQFVPKKVKEEKQKENEQYLCFYQHLISYSYLENSFHEGFHKAVDSLEISDFKDNLSEYAESEKEKEIPLSHLRTRTETRLIDLTEKGLHGEEEDIHPILEEMQRLLLDYELQLFPSEKEVSPGVGYVMMMVLFLLALGYSLVEAMPQ